MADDSMTCIQSDGTNLKRLTEEAGISIYKLAQLSGIYMQTLYNVSWDRYGLSREAADAVSIALAKQLNRKPSEVYAELTGIDE